MSDIRYISAVDAADAISEKLGIPLADIVDVFADISSADVTPCDFCAYNPPSSLGRKPCTMCPACKRMSEDAHTEKNEGDTE